MDGLDIFRRDIETARAAAPSRGRLKLWELPEVLHCSVIGTCLSLADLRAAMTWLGLATPSASDHDLHARAVGLAGRQGTGAKLLGKIIDERWRLDIVRFDRATDEAAVRDLWQEARRRGEIPGAYWATLTHPATTAVLRNAVFGDVHMLSHLLGAANRADIQRLAALDEDNAQLRTRLEQESRLSHQAILSRDARIAALERERDDAVAHAATANSPSVLTATEAVDRRIEILDSRLTTEMARRTAIEQRLLAREQALSDEQARREAAEQLAIALQAEVAALERCLTPPEDAAGGEGQRLDGVRLLYVGGRLAQVGHIRAIGERLGATVEHHDGGLETSTDRLASLTSRADHVLFPVDCVSHEATVTIKRLCRQLGKRYTPLRASGVGTFVAAIANDVAPTNRCCGHGAS
jgi:hypothetical protein